MKRNASILLLIFFIFGLGNLNVCSYTPKRNASFLNQVMVSQPVSNEIIFGTMYAPSDADPQYMWDKSSFDYAYQIWEGLYAYNLSDPDTPLIPRLATDFGTWNGNSHTVTLRQGVTFHSGTKFNATAVKFTFDRLLYLTNSTGAQPSTGPGSTIYGESIIAELYEWPDGIPVLNRTEIINEYTIKFILNRPYGVWLSLLTFTASMIMDPVITPADDYVANGMTGATNISISGTGPWKFDYYSPGIETKFTRNDDYWRGAGQVETLIFSIIGDHDARNTALLTGDIDILNTPHPSYYDIMDANPDITLYEAGSGTTAQYLGFNNAIYNVTVRNAMSYAINYTYMIVELLEGESVRLKSPIPLGIQFANWSYDVPTYNLSKAREYMQSMGLGVGFTTDAQWQAASFYTVNFTYNIGNKFREDMLVLLQDNFDYIGIDVVDNGLEWSPYLDLVYNRTAPGYYGLSIWFLGWMPDYNDPSNYINSLMSNVSSYNSAQINDPLLEAYILAGLQETDQDIRKQIYWDMQKYIVEGLRPWAFGYVSRNYDAWVNELMGYPSNGIDYVYFYPCYWEEIPGDYSIQITHPSDVSYVEGSTGNVISWTMTAVNISNPTYTVYRGLTFLENDTWTSGIPVSINIDGLSAGDYTYTILAYNGPFPQLLVTDNVIVTVTSSASEVNEIPGFQIGFIIMVSSISIAYIRKRSKNKISKTNN
ncbi:MAG: Loki-CTERM sorting domain-containing protein [Candidatus Thorarchaeota archaeon]